MKGELRKVRIMMNEGNKEEKMQRSYSLVIVLGG